MIANTRQFDMSDIFMGTARGIKRYVSNVGQFRKDNGGDMGPRPVLQKTGLGGRASIFNVRLALHGGNIWYNTSSIQCVH